MKKSQANVINELTKKLLKGKEARSKNLRQELRDMRERCDKEKTILNKTIADIEADKRDREKDLAEKEINLNLREGRQTQDKENPSSGGGNEERLRRAEWSNKH